MSRYDAREPAPRETNPRAAAPANGGWSQALRRDAREFAGVAEYEFRKLVGASRSLVQPQPAPEREPTPAGRFERRPIRSRDQQAAPAEAAPSRDLKAPEPTRQA